MPQQILQRRLSGFVRNQLSPYRHTRVCLCRETRQRNSLQIVEIPPIELIVSEHRLHQLTCFKCGTETRAKWPDEVNPSGYGVRVVAIVALLSGVYRNSQRMVQSALAELFDISVSLGTINKLRLSASVAVASCVDAAQSFTSSNKMSSARMKQALTKVISTVAIRALCQGWLWVAVTPLVTFFEIALTRCTQAAKNLLGENFTGILNSDRHGAYNWVDLNRRQLCWAHLRREFIKISERPGVSKELGTALVKQQEKLFEFWHRVRDGTLARCDFIELVKDIRTCIKATLEEASEYEVATREKTPREDLLTK